VGGRLAARSAPGFERSGTDAGAASAGAQRDLFAEKLIEVPFTGNGRFPDFKGPHVVPGTPSADPSTDEFKRCYEAACNYLHDLFISRNKQNKEIYSHITCATDTKNVEVVFNACKVRAGLSRFDSATRRLTDAAPPSQDIILKSNLHGSGFM